MSQLTLCFFGSHRLELDGVPIHIPRRKAMALLAYLAVTGQSHSRDSLATLLWPENDQSSARAELRRTLSVLNRTLGSGWLNIERETVSWTPDPVNSFWLDVDEYQGKHKICESHNHPPTVTCPECLIALEEAVDLYTDDFMNGFSLKDCREYEEWQFFQAENLRAQLTNALVRLSSHFASDLDYETAIAHARRWLVLDPLREDAHRQLMTLFWRSGQRNAALRQYEQCKQALEDELRVEPSEETRELYQKIRASTLLTAAELHPKSNLPVQMTPFIGRESELAEIQTMLKQDDCRLLTLLGPGGSGKTWLAIEAARGLLDEFRHGVFFVNLAPLEDPARIPTTIASALRFSFYKEGTPEEQLLDYLRNKELLLIMDNFEHLLTSVSFLNHIQNEAPSVKILATSRTSLNVSSENIFDVWGMAYPESPAAVKTTINQYSAVKLFGSAAKRRQASFELSTENIPDVIRICALVEGMPLEIVLAASWTKVLNPNEIATEIARDLSFLEKELQDLPERQRSLQSVFNHSWRLLSDREQSILSALSVFRGGFTRKAAQAVADASLGDLMGLIDKTFLRRGAEGCFEIHELLRQYAAKKLESDPLVEKASRTKHSNYYCQALANWESDLEGSRQGIAQAEMTSEIDNIHIAWAWGVENARLRMILNAINALCHFYNGHYQRVEAEGVCCSLLERLDEIQSFTQTKAFSKDEEANYHCILYQLRVRVLAWCGYFNWLLGNLKRARELSERGLTLINSDYLTTQDFRFEKGVCLHNLAYTKQYESQGEAIRLMKASLDSFKSIDNHWWVGLTTRSLGEFSTSSEDRISYYEESLAVFRKAGNLTGTAGTLLYLSVVAAYQCDFDKARQMVTEALVIYRKIPLQTGIVDSYRLLGSYLVWQGKFIEARSAEMKMLDIYVYRGASHTVAFANAIAGYPDLSLGEYEAAYDQAKYGLSLCRKENHRSGIYGIAYAISILGRVAQARKNYQDAEEWFQECIPIYQNLGQHNNVGQDMASLGQIARKKGQLSKARGYLIDSLKIALEEKAFLPLSHALPGIALIYHDQGEIEQAVELYALASTQGYVANSKWFADIAGDEIAAAAKQLPVEVAEAAKVRGRWLDLWETAAELLVDLKEKGWDNSDK